MKKRPFFNQLIEPQDFELLKNRLRLCRESLCNRRPENHINFLDYHVIFEFNRNNGIDFYNETIRYAFGAPVFIRGNLIMHPVHLFEMEQNIKKVQDKIKRITSEELKLLNNNNEFQEFCWNLKLYLQNNRDFSFYFPVLKSFKTALYFNSEPKIMQIFKKAVTLFYYEKIYVNTYENIIAYLRKNRNLLNGNQIMQKFGENAFSFDQDIYRRCYKYLSNIRNGYQQNINDSICAATCIKFRDDFPDLSTHFFTSPAPFDAFFQNCEINSDHEPIVVDAITSGMLRLIPEKFTGESAEIEKYLSISLKKLDTYLGTKNRNTDREANLIYRELCSDFRVDLISAISKFASEPTDAFLEIMLDLDEEDISHVLEDDLLFNIWSSAMSDFIGKLQNFLQNGNLSSQQAEALKKLDEFLLFFHGFLENDIFMSKQYLNISDKIKIIKTDNFFRRPENVLTNIESIILLGMNDLKFDYEARGLSDLIRKAERLPTISEKTNKLIQDRILEASSKKNFILAGYLQDLLPYDKKIF